MSKTIKISFSACELGATLFDNQTARAIADLLPIEAQISLWGNEIYFPLQGEISLDLPQETVQLGDLAYWPEGNCLCIFFGSTPASSRNVIRPASPVVVFARVTGDLSLFQKAKLGADIKIF